MHGGMVELVEYNSTMHGGFNSAVVSSPANTHIRDQRNEGATLQTDAAISIGL
jgi:hypothetical protein